MNSQQWQSKVVPAQLGFLAIYNPTLGITDETFAEQLVYYYSRKFNEARAIKKKKSGQHGGLSEAELREEENEKLRQIGLAQGMVDFARTFSDGKAVDSVETEKSRIVLHELEKGWWILASVNLTQLPSVAAPNAASTGKSSKDAKQSEAKPTVEYSSREVSPPALLIQQLKRAHATFCLHHGRSLSDLFVRTSKDKFCNMLDRFWTRFSKLWDVLLHGNPAVEILDGLKLAAGGELGFGVGEEEWGSGERAVLEDLVRRNEGLVDVVVARYGGPSRAKSESRSAVSQGESLVWMGCGNLPTASDGVIFGGCNAIAKSSLRDVSSWMQQLYTFGDHAYGVRDNPHRDRRKRRKRNPPSEETLNEDVASDDTNTLTGSTGTQERSVLSAPASPMLGRDSVSLQKIAVQRQAARTNSADLIDKKLLPKDDRLQVHDRVASHDHATGVSTPQVASNPGIPPPIINAAEQSLDAALAKADRKLSVERWQQLSAESRSDEDSGTTMGIPDQYMKYLTFGLSTLGKSYARQKSPSPGASRSQSTKPQRETLTVSDSKINDRRTSEGDQPMKLRHVDPLPDGESIKYQIARQKRLEEKGHFVIGLKGDLDELPDEAEATDGSFDDDSGGSRISVRTLQVDLGPKLASSYAEEIEDALRGRRGDYDLPTPGGTLKKNHKRVRVVVYVRRPFMYCLLFEQRTASLTYSRLYKDLHTELAAIHKPLLASTDPSKVAQRLAAAQAASPDLDAADKSRSPNRSADHRPIYDLIYDPTSLTIHTSIPNIPEPGTPAAEGILAFGSRNDETPSWTRIDALNVHSHILSTVASTKRNKAELERTSKTNRGWWVVWMKLAAATSDEEARSNSKDETVVASSSLSKKNAKPDTTENADDTQSAHLPPNTEEPSFISTRVPTTIPEQQRADKHRIAFLVRKASDATNASGTKSSGGGGSSAANRAASGMLGSLGWRRSEDEETGGASAGWGPAALAGGIGIDARRYVEGLLSLNR